MNTRRNCMKPRGWAFFATICAAALALPLFADPVQIDPADYECSFNVKFVGYKGTSTLTDFPVLIRLSKALNDFNYAKCTDGASLRFADSAGNLIPHEIDTWNENGTSLVWVKVPSLTKETVIKVCYGYKGSGTPPSATASDVWSNGYVGVWHLNESTLPMKESSGVSTDFSNAGGSGIVYGADGAIGRAVDFSGGDNLARLIADDDDDLDGFTDCTFEVWTKQNNERNRSMGIFEKRKSNTEDQSYYIYNSYTTNAPQKDGRNVFVACTNGTQGVSYPVGTDTNMEPVWDQWCHQAFVRDATGTRKGYGYVNGTKKTGQAQKTDPIHASAQPLHLGNNHSGAQFNGIIDEARISNVARSDDWVIASHDTVADSGFAVCVAGQNDWTSYHHKFRISFEHAFTDDTELEYFPVLVRIAEYDEATGNGIRGFDYDDCVQGNGGDLRFADKQGNLLPSEVETWDPSGESLVWVRVPTLSTNTTLTAYYGCALPGEVTPTAVWSPGYVGVWHLDESALPLRESSGVSTAFSSSVNRTETLGAAGMIGGAVDFSAGDSNSRLSAEDDSDFDCFTDMTIELWSWQAGPSVNSMNGIKNAYILAKRTKNNEDAALALYNNSAPTDPAKHGRNVLMVSTNGTSWSYVIMTSNNMEPTWGAWCHQAFVRDAAGNKGYWSLSGSRSNGNGTGSEPLFNTASKLHLGNSQGGGVNFNGLIDELRISRVVRSQAWLKASHDTVAMRNFATCGEATEIVNGFVTIIR